ncbi:MAG TPA: hypothetical protein VHP58_03250 [Alphaproteobacteria bacterium]|nr:hypothetical protein [Alphaproteobacteria bacterium]
MKKRRSSLPLIAVIAIGGAGWFGWHYYQTRLAEHLGAGVPLDQTHSTIKVLSPSGEVPTGLPTTTTSNAIIGEPHGAKHADNAPIILTSSTVITTPAPVAPQVDTKNIKLGIALSLLAQNYAAGGPAALGTLETAAKLAAGTPLEGKLADLRKNTPANGPITPVLLLVEAQRIRVLGAPAAQAEELPATDWLHKLVKVRNAAPEEATATWAGSMQSAMLQLAANNPGGASTLLNATPLDKDTRLDDLRTALAGYLAQTTSLNDALAAYIADESTAK